MSKIIRPTQDISARIRLPVCLSFCMYHLQKPGGPKVARAALRRRAKDGQFAVI